MFGAATSNVNPRNGADLHFFIFRIGASTRTDLPSELRLSAVFLPGPHDADVDLLQPNELCGHLLQADGARGLSEVTQCRAACSAEASSFSLALEEGEVVTLADGSLDVSDDGSGLVADELGLDLGDTTTRA